MNINLKDFDLDIFLLGRKLVLESRGLDTLEKVCEQFAIQRQVACLLAPPGTGVENFLQRYKEENVERVFTPDCFSSSNIFADLMMQITMGHRLVNWYDTPVANVVEALVYYLNTMNNRNLIFFNHCDALKLPRFADLMSEFSRFKNCAGIVFRITPDYGEKITKSSNSVLRHHIAQYPILEIGYPTEANLIKVCHTNGIVSETVARGLVKDTFDFDIVESRIDQLRRDVKSFLGNGGKSR